jgi:hypothetical protein
MDTCFAWPTESRSTMIPRRLTAGLLAAWAVLTVTFAVVMGFYLLLQQLGDDVGLTVLAWVGRFCLIAVVVVFVLLVVSLAWERLAADEET